MPRNQVDLHVHSTASDGEYTPAGIVDLALAGGLTAIALTDHDTLKGVPAAVGAAAGTPLEVVPGVEINAEGEWGDIHFLGYYVNVEAGTLAERLELMHHARIARAEGMVRKLQGLGLRVTWEEVQALAGEGSVGRPHVARVLVQRGYVPSVGAAFERYIGSGGPAYVPRPKFTPQQVIEAVLEAGGVPVLAHPVTSGCVGRVLEFVGYGLRGVEVYYPGHTSVEIEHLLGLCRRYGLVPTGGTDFHGPSSGEGMALGSIYVPPDCVAQLRQAVPDGC